MRQGQQNKRIRGRNRKGPNPLTRSYESNGPDVKIRGTAHHIAEKYLSLARDAQSSGDRVAAESYLQHAEHYFRLIAAAQQQFAQSPQMSTPDQPYVRGEEEDDDEPMQNDRFYSNIPPPPQFNQNNNGQPYRGGDSPGYNGNNNRDQQGYNANNREQQPYTNGNGSEGAPRGNQQPPQAEGGGSYDEAGFGGEPPAFVGGGQGAGNNEPNFNNNQPGNQEGGNYRRRRRSGRDRPRFQERGPDNNTPPQGTPSEGGGGPED